MVVPSDPGQDLEVLVEGEVFRDALFRGFQRVRILRPLEAAAGSMRLEVADRRPFPLRPGDRVGARVNGQTVFDGWVDSLDASIESDRRTVAVGARDRTADLIDARPDGLPTEFVDLGLEELARAIAAPLEVEVVRSNTLSPFNIQPPFERFSLQPGETAWAAIERACRLRGALAYSPGDGTLLLSAVGVTRSSVPVVEGDGGNVLSARLRWSNADRYRTYRVLGQRPGNDLNFGDAVAAVVGTSLDLEIGRPRLLEIVAEGQVSIDTATKRAEWEATVRAARAQTITATLQGLLRTPLPTADVWRVNELVPFQSVSFGLDTELLCRAVQLERTPTATTTTLELVPKGSYAPRPDVAERDEPNPFDGVLAGEESDA